MATVPEGKVKVIRGRAYGPGAELPGGRTGAQKPVAEGLAEGFPHRELLTNYKTPDALRAASDEELLAIDGIGDARLKEIRQALK
jgi:hypothetical protein